MFQINFPETRNNPELNKVKAQYPQYDGSYVASACIQERKIRLNNLWPKFESYADRNFLTEIQTSFHPRSWEMYLCNVLLDKGFTITEHSEQSSPPRDEGPDFFLNDGTYIECIAVSKGSPDSVHSVPMPHIATNSDDMVCENVPTEKIILRITSAIKEKGDKYKGWQKKEWFQNNAPYIIAINTAEIVYPQDYLGIPLIINTLFGLQYLQIGKNGVQNFFFTESINKGSSKVPVTYFTTSEYNFISGIIFSNEYVFDHPEKIGEDCIFVNNPFAEHPVESSFFEKFKSFKAEKEKLTKLYG